ncbi:DNA repair protein RecO [Methylibium petroleiphilum]|uniref:DNA repair protein RecO n=1 Tax=Methylibium petroleiphilum (strain ATCC BAA-1232 / LMG 22953 / PM1) TaxID=420662 RepID=A2SDH5_METPP|nr:DNA repair protein RecO [Methylibium petroleiphilum]ABM93614.1 DNA replication and repair protein RecO [Methylibium petroleiphilum PM1]
MRAAASRVAGATPQAARGGRAAAPALQPAYLLHRYDWSESSLILDLFTREHGRVAVAAKGAKRPYSQLRAVLLPFQRLQVAYGVRRPREGDGGEVQPLKTAEWAGGPAMLGGAALLTGFYLNELLMKLLARQDPHPALFDAYAHTLPALGASDDARVAAALRGFELVLLREIGLLPELGRVTLTQQPLGGGVRHALKAESGLVAAAAGEVGLAADDWRALQAALDADDLAALQRACLPVLADLKPMLRNLLHYHLATPVLRTRQLMMDLQNLDR